MSGRVLVSGKSQSAVKKKNILSIRLFKAGLLKSKICWVK